ncbi:transposase [Okeania sp. SIO3B5]|uniref:transposase n=1 Tax=Okeania sp. SIO3B5 TaxID=2607811 RepID=UPI003455A20C
MRLQKFNPPKITHACIDLGLLHYAVTSDGEFIEVPKFFRLCEHRLSKLQVRLAKKQKHSKSWKILKRKIAKLHQLIARQRLDWQFKLAYHLFSDISVIFARRFAALKFTSTLQSEIS